MRRMMLRCAAGALLLLLGAGSALAQDICALPAPPAGQPDRDALWRIVHCQCATATAQGLAPPLPCTGLLGGGALLKDRVGVSQYLLMPVSRITGIEDPALLAPGAPNYFAMAWAERGMVGLALRKALERDMVGLAVNAAVARTQDQLHIHLDCLRPEVRAALGDQAATIGTGWAPLAGPLAGWRARRLAGEGDRLEADPFALLAAEVPGAASVMDEWTVLVTATAAPPGFVALATRYAEAGNAEALQDHGCALAR